MKQHLNTLFVLTQGAYLAKEGQAVAVRVDKEVRLRLPLHTLGGIVCLGRVGCSPALLAASAQAGVATSDPSSSARSPTAGQFSSVRHEMSGTVKAQRGCRPRPCGWRRLS